MGADAMGFLGIVMGGEEAFYRGILLGRGGWLIERRLKGSVVRICSGKYITQ